MAPAEPPPGPAVAPSGSALGLRIGVFVGVLVLAGALVAVVLRHDSEAPTRARAAAVTVQTFSVPPEILVPVTRVFGTGPPTSGPSGTGVSGTGRRLTNDQVQLALEVAIKRSTGWTHKVLCVPDQVLARGEVLGCRATTEPPIREVQPSNVLAVVIDDDGRFVWARAFDGPLTLDALQAPGLTCADLLARGYPWVAALAYDETHRRPATLGRDGDGRPCVDEYGADVVDDVFNDQLVP